MCVFVCICGCPGHAIEAKINTSANKCRAGVEFVLLNLAEVMSFCMGGKDIKKVPEIQIHYSHY